MFVLQCSLRIGSLSCTPANTMFSGTFVRSRNRRDEQTFLHPFNLSLLAHIAGLNKNGLHNSNQTQSE